MAKSKSKKIHVFTRFKKKKKKEKVEKEMETQLQQPLKTVEDLHQEVEEVAQAMQQNIVKMRDREGKLEILVDKGERLEEEANQFAVMSSKARRKMWLRTHRRNLILIAVVIFLLLIILVTVILIILWKSGLIFVD